MVPEWRTQYVEYKVGRLRYCCWTSLTSRVAAREEANQSNCQRPPKRLSVARARLSPKICVQGTSISTCTCWRRTKISWTEQVVAAAAQAEYTVAFPEARAHTAHRRECHFNCWTCVASSSGTDAVTTFACTLAPNNRTTGRNISYNFGELWIFWIFSKLCADTAFGQKPGNLP
jgi:hypothetical protein